MLRQIADRHAPKHSEQICAQIPYRQKEKRKSGKLRRLIYDFENGGECIPESLTTLKLNAGMVRRKEWL